MNRRWLEIRKHTVTAFAVGLTLCFFGSVSSANNHSGCTSIQDGVIEYSSGHYLAGQPLQPGYDAYGYNYQARMFRGSYANAYLGGAGFPPHEGDDDAYLEEYPAAAGHWTWPYRDVTLIMQWNDAWLSNRDCDGDGSLDRHHGHASYIGSGAWITNHMRGGKGRDSWNYFVKIVAVPDDAELDDGVWYTADGEVIGPEIWGQFAIIQEVDTDSPNFVSPVGPGLGKW